MSDAIEVATRDLTNLTVEHGTDKGPDDVTRLSVRGRRTLTGKDYVTTYGRFFAELRDRPIRFLEIGIDRGQSIPVWEEFFSHAQLSAIDIKSKCRAFETERTRVFIGSQTDVSFLESVVSQAGPFDVIIDDGGHTMEQHAVSFQTLWPTLNPGGLYAIEDTHTAYDPHFGGSFPSTDSTVEKLKTAIDALQGRGHGAIADLHGMWFAPSIVVLVKKPRLAGQ